MRRADEAVAVLAVVGQRQRNAFARAGTAQMRIDRAVLAEKLGRRHDPFEQGNDDRAIIPRKAVLDGTPAVGGAEQFVDFDRPPAAR